MAAGVTFVPTFTRKREIYQKAFPFVVIPGTIKSGQVLKAKTLLEYTADGKLQAHSGIVESAIVTFGSALTNGQTLILSGLTWTAGASGTTIAQLITAWKDIKAGTGYAALSSRTGGGSFTAGLFAGFASYAKDASSLVISYYLAATDGSNITATGTGSAAVSDIDINTSSFPSTIKPVAGMTLFDVDATSANTESQIIIKASFWAEAINWVVDVDSDYILTGADDTKVYCTAYNTGAFGTSTESNRLKRLLVANGAAGVDFTQLGFSQLGDL